MDAITRRVPGMTPARLARTAMELVGDEGTILMPTLPFQGSQLDWLQTATTFDVRRTPSRMGLASEIFRRMPGVQRSLHPTHPVAAWGKRAAELLSQHHEGPAFAETSPYYRMTQCGGIAVVIGAPAWANTLLHVAEYLHPVSSAHAYHDQSWPVTVIDGERRFEYQVYPLRMDRPRNPARGLRTLIREGVVKCSTRRGLKTATCDASQLVARSLELIEANRYYEQPVNGNAKR
jgi:aminoglycoside 3-N-acetyltransferase